MFLYNLGYRWNVPSNTQLQGVIVNAAGVDRESALRREARENFPRTVLFDPQLYLAGLDVEVSSKTCARLSTYPFFPVEVTEFDSSSQSVRDWMKKVSSEVAESWPPQLPTEDEQIRSIISSAIRFQITFEASDIILPMPLLEAPDFDFSLLTRWMDIGHSVFSELSGDLRNGQIPLITIPLSDQLLHASPPSANSVLQGIIDHLTARSEIRGVYLVIGRGLDSHDRITSANVALSVFHMAHVLGIVRGLRVLVNFAEQLGLFALSAGAAAFGSGYETKAQRCCLMDFVERGGGGGFPRFYSLATLCDYLPERDMVQKFVPKRLLHILASDEQPASAHLFSALRTGAPQQRVPPDWAEVVNNIQAAQTHYIQLITAATDELNGLATHPEKVQRALAWLQRAEQNATYLNTRFEGDPLSDTGAHVGAWRQAFEQYIEEFHLI